MMAFRYGTAVSATSISGEPTPDRNAYSTQLRLLPMTADDVAVARLSVFAAMCDIGKVNVGFQTQSWDRKFLRGHRPMRREGHTSAIVPIIGDNAPVEYDHETAD